ncbi:hypothetical protein LTR84_001656 [Exophiala bonariae]|uniref:Zn(2)-C6 fungal-type domain-containing protein n=1 Tax=Exophiala bonariae TaxID=1690606 RepID=A0AAV9NAX1_9EURO|nr:hypothetical protein LTR84_001656 [Exophiala bonariae]
MATQMDHDTIIRPGAGGLDAVSAPMRACEACNRKKTKCDMARPNCGLCRRTGRACKFPTTRKLPRTSLKQPHSSYSQPLNNNLKWLLNFLEEDTSDNNLNAKQDRLFAAMSGVHRPTIGELSPRGRPTAMNTNPQQDTTGQLFDPDPSSQTLEYLIALPHENDHDQPLEPEFDNGSIQSQIRAGSHKKATCMPSVPYDLAMDLIETFFVHVQPWLPLLHKPRFMAQCQQELKPGSHSLDDLYLETALLLTGMFGLAARFSTNPAFQDIDPLQRDSQYITPARRVYGELRNTRSSSLAYLQGCIVLAFHAYTDELNSSAWILSGVCVRLAYDLELSEIDSDDDSSAANQLNYDQTDLEEMRRAWWLTWELDTFGSLMTRKPFAVDRHHFTVRLPFADSDWFAGRPVESAELLTAPEQSWKSLQASENQNPRAWFLIANHLLSLLIQYMYRKQPESGSAVCDLLPAFNCLKLSWPSSFDILINPPRFDEQTFSDFNWIFGTHLMLTTAYSLLDSAATDGSGTANPMSIPSLGMDRKKSFREISFSQIVMRWPPEYMVASHPFFVCNVMPTNFEFRGASKRNALALYEAVGDTAELVIAQFARRWKLAGQALTVFRLLRNPSSDAEVDGDLRRRFAAFFARETASRSHKSIHKLVHSGSPSYDRNTQHDLTTSQNYVLTTQENHLSRHNGLGDSQGSADGFQDHQGTETSSFIMTPSLMMPHISLDQVDSQASPYTFSDILVHTSESIDAPF